MSPCRAAYRAIAVWRVPELAIVTLNAAGKDGVLYEFHGFGPATYKDDIQGLPNAKGYFVRGEYGRASRSLHCSGYERTVRIAKPGAFRASFQF